MSPPIRGVGAKSPTERLRLSRSHDSVTYTAKQKQGYGGGSPQRRSETWRATEYREGFLGRGMGAEAPNEGASLGERLSIRRALHSGDGGGSPQRRSETCRTNEYRDGFLGRGMGAVAPNEGASLGERLSIRRVLLRLSLDSAGWRRAKVRLRPAALQRQLTRLSASVSVVQPLPR